MGTRAERVGEQVRAAIAGALLTEVNDPRLEQVSVTAVRLTDDLSFGRVYWTLLATEQDPKVVAKAAKALKSAAPFMRKHVSKTVHLRHTPELIFEKDTSLAYGRRIDEILSDIEIPEEVETPENAASAESAEDA
ncbi:MAG: ribosome-binding factor A [Bradymonadia bacterium]|jgi:ribosome-binding factor A